MGCFRRFNTLHPACNHFVLPKNFSSNFPCQKPAIAPHDVILPASFALFLDFWFFFFSPIRYNIHHHTFNRHFATLHSSFKSVLEFVFRNFSISLIYLYLCVNRIYSKCWRPIFLFFHRFSTVALSFLDRRSVHVQNNVGIVVSISRRFSSMQRAHSLRN